MDRALFGAGGAVGVGDDGDAELDVGVSEKEVDSALVEEMTDVWSVVGSWVGEDGGDDDVGEAEDAEALWLGRVNSQRLGILFESRRLSISKHSDLSDVDWQWSTDQRVLKYELVDKCGPTISVSVPQNVFKP
jgi:hypothetical protein